MPLSDREHDAFDNPAKALCRDGNLRVLREAAYRPRYRISCIRMSRESGAGISPSKRICSMTKTALSVRFGRLSVSTIIASAFVLCIDALDGRKVRKSR